VAQFGLGIDGGVARFQLGRYPLLTPHYLHISTERNQGVLGSSDDANVGQRCFGGDFLNVGSRRDPGRTTPRGARAAAGAPPSRKPHTRSKQELVRRLASRLGVRGSAAAAIIALIAAGSGIWWSQRGGESHPKTAAIIDQLSLTAPGPDFVASTTKMLTQAGYRVDYFPGEQVTVEFYRHLPQRDYDLVILRAHLGLTTVINEATGAVTHTKDVSIFTGEPFDGSQYQAEQDAGRLGRSYLAEDGTERREIFGIMPDFVRFSMQGRFRHTLVVLMGCNGLDAPTTARSFLDKGASAVVGWDNFVSADFTDKVTERFLDMLLTRNVPVADAVQQTATELGRDPTFGGQLQLVNDRGVSPPPIPLLRPG